MNEFLYHYFSFNNICKSFMHLFVNHFMHLKRIAQVLEVCIVPSNIETLPQVLSMKKLREGFQASAFITMISTLQKEYL